MTNSRTPLQALTYLAPSLPIELFALVCDRIGAALGREIHLRSEDRHSGPMHREHDPFASGEVDIGFLCSPSYVYLRSVVPASVGLVPAAPVFDDERLEGRPQYFSEVMVRADDDAASFVDLEGRVWGFNDTCSLSGYINTCNKLRELGQGDDFFERQVDTGSHLRSMEALLSGQIDGASIDSNVLARLHLDSPEIRSRLKVVESWGPFPIQPLVIRAELAEELAGPIAQALLELDRSSRVARRLAALGVRGFAPVSADDYEEELCALRELGLSS
jgi:phosphonate transport system substrate-binding protein